MFNILSFVSQWILIYSRSSLSGLAYADMQLYVRPPWQNPVWTLAHTNSVFIHSRKRPVPFADTFFASRGCPLTGASTVLPLGRLTNWEKINNITYKQSGSSDRVELLLSGHPRGNGKWPLNRGFIYSIIRDFDPWTGRLIGVRMYLLSTDKRPWVFWPKKLLIVTVS